MPYTVTLPSGSTWIPRFVAGIDDGRCIGCGRCFKVCGRAVLELRGIDADGRLVAVDPDADDDEEYEKKVMTVAQAGNCIGCQACARICPKQCYTHAPREA